MDNNDQSQDQPQQGTAPQSAPQPQPGTTPQPASQPQQAQPQAQGYQPQPQQFQQPPVQQAPVQQPPMQQQSPMQQPPMQQPSPYQTPVQAAPPDKSTTCIVISVLEIIFAGGFLSIIPLVFSVMYKNAYAAGDYVRAEKNHKTARILLIIFGILGIIVDIFYFMNMATLL